MSQPVPEPDPSPQVGEVEAALAGLDQAIQVLAGLQLWRLNDAAARETVVGIERARRGLDSVFLRHIADLQERPGAVAGAVRDQIAATLLIHACHYSSPHAHVVVRAAQAAAEGGLLPLMAQALAEGLVSIDHVQVAAKVIAKLPTALLSGMFPDPQAEQVQGEPQPLVAGVVLADRFLTNTAKTCDPKTLSGIGAQLRAVLDPDAGDGFDPDAYTRRELTYASDGSGMLVGRFALDPAGGALLQAALTLYGKDHGSGQAENEDGLPVDIRDIRSTSQRQADALAAVAAAAIRHHQETHPDPGGPLGLVVVTATPEQVSEAQAEQQQRQQNRRDCTRPRPGVGLPVAETGPMPLPSFAALACDALLQALTQAGNGQVLNLGRTVRIASPAQRRALSARDLGCVVPGCHAPPSRCQAHHVKWWRFGGRTDITNLALICNRHHTEIHLGIWDLEMIDGLPWARPPAWANRQRPLLRNTTHTTVTAARALAEQLRLPIDPDPHPDPDDRGDRPDQAA